MNLAQDLGYLKGTCDAILRRLDDIESKLDNPALVERVHKLERGRAWLIGAAAAFGLGGGAIGSQSTIPALPPMPPVVTSHQQAPTAYPGWAPSHPLAAPPLP